MELMGLERKVLLETYGKWAWFLRNRPDHAAHYLAGVILPPHERSWLRLYNANYKENNIVASRGTSKSFTMASFAAFQENHLYKGLRTLVLSASGFRGGKLLFEDGRRLILGHLADQRIPAPYLENSCMSGGKVLRRQPDMWTVESTSKSVLATIPTNNEENMRGFRAHKTIVDERNTFPGEVVQVVVRPMMVVGQSFEKAAQAGDDNQLFQIGTIDYTVRDWHKEIQATRKTAKLEWEAWKARKRGDWAVYDRLMEENDGALKTSSVAYSRYDYTDLLIPEEIQDWDGNIWKVDYPFPDHLEKSDIYRYDEHDKKTYIYTYPVDKKGLEEPLRNGTMDEELWLAEQRNVFINAAGNVYSPDLIRKAAETPIYEQGKLGSGSDEWFAPVMWSTGDPCVLGVDYGRERDHFAVVVFRLGEMAEGPFAPWDWTLDKEQRPIMGKTSWNNVIWAESHEKWTAQQAADKVRELRRRYNVVATTNARGIAMDKQGGGTAVRDELAVPKPPMGANGKPIEGWEAPVRIYDPDDEDYSHFGGFDPQDYWPGLELLKPTNALNVEWTNASKALLQKGKVYIAYYQSPSQWAHSLGLTNANGQPDTSNPMFQRMLVGYNGIHRLVRQLLRIQMKMSAASGTIRYVMPGDKSKEEGKKDLYSAFIYGSHLVREHVVALTRDGAPKPPTATPIVVQVGKNTRRRKDVRQWRSIR